MQCAPGMRRCWARAGRRSLGPPGPELSARLDAELRGRGAGRSCSGRSPPRAPTEGRRLRQPPSPLPQSLPIPAPPATAPPLLVHWTSCRDTCGHLYRCPGAAVTNGHTFGGLEPHRSYFPVLWTRGRRVSLCRMCWERPLSLTWDPWRAPPLARTWCHFLPFLGLPQPCPLREPQAQGLGVHLTVPLSQLCRRARRDPARAGLV